MPAPNLASRSGASAVVIGAGVGGLAVACRLAARGWHVTVLEANGYTGGKLSEIVLGDYRFDAGPSLCTLPERIKDVFRAAGRNPDDYIQFQALPLTCRYFYPDGTRLDAHQQPEAFANEVHTVLGVPPNTVTRALAKSRRLYNVAGNVFLNYSLHRWRTYFTPAFLKGYLQLPLREIFRTMHASHVARLRHPKLVQLWDRYATYNGSDPHRAPAVLSLIPHLEHGIGAVYPVGGMHAITLAFTQLATELGVDIRLNTPAKQIQVVQNQATGVLAATGEHFPAQVVVSGLDVVPTYRRLLPGTPAPERTLRQERSSSALIFYWGIRASFPELHLHNIFFSSDYQHEFKQIFTDKTAPEDPTIYLNITRKLSPEDAPDGHENWFILVNVPADEGQDWAALRIRTRAAVLRILSQRLGRDIEPLIAVEDFLDPPRIQARTGSHQGALYGTASNNRFAAFLRHPNFSRRIRNLYFVGGSVHPGGGVPLCLASAELVESLVPKR